MNQTLTLPDGTVVKIGDKVRARGEGTGWRVCKVLNIHDGRALLTAPTPFGTVSRSRHEIKRGD